MLRSQTTASSIKWLPMCTSNSLTRSHVGDGVRSTSVRSSKKRTTASLSERKLGVLVTCF